MERSDLVDSPDQLMYYEVQNGQNDLNQQTKENFQTNNEEFDPELQIQKMQEDETTRAQQELEDKHAKKIEALECSSALIRLQLEMELESVMGALSTAEKKLVKANSEQDDLRSHIQQQDSALNRLREEGQKKLELLGSQLKKYKSNRSKEKNERHAFEFEVKQLALDKDSQILLLQEELMEKSRSLEQQAFKSQEMSAVIEEKDSEIKLYKAEVAEKTKIIKELDSEIEAMHAVVHEKNSEIVEAKNSESTAKAVAASHLEKNNEWKQKHETLSKEFDDHKTEYKTKFGELQTETKLHKRMSMQVQVYKEGLLGKKTRARKMMGLMWSVKHFTLYCGSLHYKEKQSRATNSGKVFRMDHTTIVEKVESIRCGFRIRAQENLLILQAFDEEDLASWMKAAQESINAMKVRAQLDEFVIEGGE
uniref:PH domain-containing protein n=1 Tax=Octactis speculum TaxID=3111310 RepID=A0A7S2CFV2_9STRA|mmetsp:Transcript_35566/g.48029  ORF Transcript_35566/g.48029 Transcript_35566/m.48029 type:complete len:422 (+) Transcript_35566:119-1384(+)|eukprot:CAMPEP_0185763310 /NCGR_PEP_ID=MMETSP1174-20130828/22243_1 /TAXON_ID=35687 /ORGANISM="Dictyocha speculum, Strain CCMP1381" /LENGTH=421 /DNA_ID=CAMNT_0028445365 /DNA_START=109 /DNA_END=1374 /DNA_ORIENTATION=-